MGDDWKETTREHSTLPTNGDDTKFVICAGKRTGRVRPQSKSTPPDDGEQKRVFHLKRGFGWTAAN